MTKCHSSVSVPTELVPVLSDEASPVAGVRTVAAAGAKLVEVDQLAADMKHHTVQISAANRLTGEVVQSRRRPLLGPSPG